MPSVTATVTSDRKNSAPQVPKQKEGLLIVESAPGQAAKLQRELAVNGYRSAVVLGQERRFTILDREEWALIIVAGIFLTRSRRAFSETAEAETYKVCQRVKSHPRGKRTPTMLVVPAWDSNALARGLEVGADFFLFAPYQAQDLLRSVRHALLNGCASEPAKVTPEIEVIYQDRMHTLTASPGRLARVLFALFEDLRQSRSSLSWSQAEVAELRRQLRQEQRRNEGGTFIAATMQGITHDLGNLLETIGAAVAVLKEELPKPPSSSVALEAALAQAETLLTALRNVASLGHSPSLETVNPAAVVQEAVQGALLPLCAPNVRVRLRVNNLPPIRANAVLLARCLSNLIGNAVQEMPSGGLLSIAGTVRDDSVVLEVSDTGPGIPVQDRSKIFEPRYTTKSGHLGLGLPLVRGLVTQMEGDIAVVSRPAQGTTFALSFPVAALEAATEHPSSTREHSAAVL